MTILEAVVYGVIQGLTEFLPVSSSAHLVLLPWLTGWKDPGLAFDVALHWGTLVGVLIYFGKDVFRLVRVAFVPSAGDSYTPARLPWQIAAATVPGAIFGFVLEHQAETVFRNPIIIAANLFFIGLFLQWTDRGGNKSLDMASLSWARAILIGVSQGFAIVPGVSRSGITIAVALLIGLSRPAAVRFSFYLSIPIIAGAGLLKFPYLVQNSGNAQLWIGLLASAISGIAAIHLLLTFVKTKSFTPFVIYRMALAVLIIVMHFSRAT